MLRLHHYCKRKKVGETRKRLKPPDLAADDADSGGRNRVTRLRKGHVIRKRLKLLLVYLLLLKRW